MPIRALTIAAVVMGVLIVAGTVTLGVLIVRRASVARTPAAAPLAAAAAPVPFGTSLDEPSGTRIAGIAAMQDRLAVLLQGGGPDRVVLIDPRTGALTGAVMLAR